MKHVLIPTDFSECAWNAVKYALTMFRNQECTFYLLNTYTPAISSSRFMATSLEEGRMSNSAEEYSKMGLAKVLERIRNEYGNKKHQFKTISSFSLLVDEIVETVALYKIEMVIMGTKGASSIEDVFMGSNTVGVIKTIKDCPVLAIPYNHDFKRPSEIAFATDFTRFYTKSELRPLIELANFFEATIRVVHVQYEIKNLTELQQFNLEMLRKYLGDVEHYIHTISELNSVSKTLEVFSREMGIHLLAMLNYQHSYMEQLTREPIVKRVAFHTQIPLFVIPELGMTSNVRVKNHDEMSLSK